MPEAINAGVRISYDVFGDGRPLILLHGWSCDRAWWTETGFVENLRRDHRVINVDLRGHGASDKPHEPDAYHQATVANDVIAVADAEGLDRFAIWGISYGGWVAWVTADAYPERVAAIVVTGQWDASPGTDDAAWQAFEDSWLSALRSDGMDGLLKQFEQEEDDALLRDPPAWARSMWLRQDPRALLAIQSRELMEEGVATLDGFSVPVLSIAGELEDPDDESAKVAASVQRGESLRLPGLAHADTGAASELTLPAARAFLARWFA